MFDRPIAHRGLHAPGGPVENSIAAALAAVAGGYGVECDVQISRDGRAMVIHDEELHRLTGETGRVAARDAAALGLLRLLDGSPVPTLDALLAAVAGRALVVVEIKAAGGPALADAVLATVAAHTGPIALESFDPAIVARCAGAAHPVGLVGPIGPGAPDLAALPRCEFLSWDIARIEEAALLRPALPLTCWTVRTTDQRERAARFGAQIVFEGFRP